MHEACRIRLPPQAPQEVLGAWWQRVLPKQGVLPGLICRLWEASWPEGYVMLSLLCLIGEWGCLRSPCGILLGERGGSCGSKQLAGSLALAILQAASCGLCGPYNAGIFT